MRSYFMIGLALVLLLAFSVIFYGIWLNEQGEYQIAERMEERRLTLSGAKAEIKGASSSNHYEHSESHGLG